MAKIERFTDLNCWKFSRELCSLIYGFFQREPFSRDLKLRDQINASSGSVMDNIAEGFERGGTKEFIQFLSYAKGSAGEVKSQLYRAFDRNYITEDEFKVAVELTDTILKTIQGLMTYLKNSNLKGLKYQVKEPEDILEFTDTLISDIDIEQ